MPTTLVFQAPSLHRTYLCLIVAVKNVINLSRLAYFIATPIGIEVFNFKIWDIRSISSLLLSKWESLAFDFCRYDRLQNKKVVTLLESKK